jgi:signal transduction histidine kinase
MAVLKEPVDMQKMVGALLAELTAASAVPLRVEMGELGPGWADRNLIRQVWYNLLSNAVKFSSREPEIRIRIGYRREPEEDRYYVEDNGVGFNPVYHEELFGVFKRLHGEAFAGTGVGLAICKRIISNHGGRIWAESESGKGATFYFSLPALLSTK